MSRFKFERFIPASDCAAKDAAIDTLFPEVDGDLTKEYRKPFNHPTDDECICSVDERIFSRLNIVPYNEDEGHYEKCI